MSASKEHKPTHGGYPGVVPQPAAPALSLPVVILREGRAILTDPARWTQGGGARNKRNVLVKPHATDAVCFCAAGAVWNAGGLDSKRALAADEALTLLAAELGSSSKARVFDWNDARGRTHAEVLDLFDRTIKNNGG